MNNWQGERLHVACRYLPPQTCDGREDWIKHRSPAIAPMSGRVVFPDETAKKTKLNRLRNWALQGTLLTMNVPLESCGGQP